MKPLITILLCIFCACEELPPDVIAPQAIAKVLIYDADSNSHTNCTGFFVDPKIVITNEHCLVYENNILEVMYIAEDESYKTTEALITHEDAYRDIILLQVEQSNGLMLPYWCDADPSDTLRIYGWKEDDPQTVEGYMIGRIGPGYGIVADIEHGFSGGPAVRYDCAVGIVHAMSKINTVYISSPSLDEYL